jgi:hypothetical protein
MWDFFGGGLHFSPPSVCEQECSQFGFEVLPLRVQRDCPISRRSAARVKFRRHPLQRNSQVGKVPWNLKIGKIIFFLSLHKP